MTDFSEMARGIIESNRYMVLGTADEDGVPWVTPVWFAQADHRRFIWVSSPQRRHSRNVRARPEVSIVIFDSQVVVGSARAVYTSAGLGRMRGLRARRRKPGRSRWISAGAPASDGVRRGESGSRWSVRPCGRE
jgi:nitroimidazol reductase NimA-like FMN-containing flavoprotein (pyridoxamine 5'-phosphate oxidase superfamily)